MSKSAMLRTRRRDVNVKPNRRLDRKSSRGMIYENEELRLRTININAEIERGQSDIKKLRRENEQLRKEIWCLRDEYDKLDKLLKEKDNSSCTSCSSNTDSCTSCSESEETETTQNLENVQKTTLNNLRSDFDHLSVVTEETSTENSDKNSQKSVIGAAPQWEALPPDMGYPNLGFIQPHDRVTTNKITLNNIKTAPQFNKTIDVPQQPPKHFFAPLKTSKSFENCSTPENINLSKSWSNLTTQTSNIYTPWSCITTNQTTTTTSILQTCEKTHPDIVVQSDNSTNSFVNGGNLEELLQDIATISDDILQISSNQVPAITDISDKPYKSEINVVLMPKPMPLIGFEKYQTIKTSLENLEGIQKSNESLEQAGDPIPVADVPSCFTPQPAFPTPEEFPPSPQNHPKLTRQPSNPFFYGSFDSYRFNPNYYANSNQSHDNFAFKNDVSSTEKLDKIDEDATQQPDEASTTLKPDTSDKELTENDTNLNKSDETTNKNIKNRRTRKVSIYFKGKKDKIARSLSLDTAKATIDAKKHFETDLLDKKDSDNQKSSDSKASYDRKHRKSSSTSPERKHVQISDAPQSGASKKCHKRRHKKSERRSNLNRRSSVSIDKFNRDQRSFSVCTDRSNILDHKFGNHSDEFFTNSERDRSNSLSSCETIKSRKLSQIPQFQVTGKIPWFGCWGNGCL